MNKEKLKVMMTLPEMVNYLQEHPDRHTPFMDRWLMLCIIHEVQVYPAKPLGAKEGKRMLYGKPPRVVECLEKCPGKPGWWYIRWVRDQKP